MKGGPATVGWLAAVRGLCNANFVGAALLVGALAVSLGRVSTNQQELFHTDKTIVRIAHWQLELGYRDGLEQIIAAYEKQHPHVRVIQMPVTEKVYPQWLNTHLISGTAPDLVEIGKALLVTDDQYLVRYFLPLTELVDRPNPYNAGTPLESLAWRETFRDGMRGAYREGLQDYFSAPTAMFTIRLFYNRSLLRDATGSTEAPRTFGELMDASAKIRELGERRGQTLIPIAGSAYSTPFFVGRYAVPFTAGFEPDLDINLDGIISPNESYIGFVQGTVGFESPAIRAYHECLKRLSDEFGPGFTAMGREQAAFLFVQGRAAMIATGSWDAKSLLDQAKFEVGIMDFPLPGPGEAWGEFIAGAVNETRTAAAATYGVYKFSPHIEQAIDFLQFMTSRRHNETFNRAVMWIPAVLGATTDEQMLPFMPNMTGYISQVDFGYGTHVRGVLSGQLLRYLQGEISYEDFARRVEEALRNPGYGGDRAWAVDYDTQKRRSRAQERLLAVQSARMLMDPAAADAPEKFQQALLQQVRANNGETIRHQFEQVRGKPIEEL
jgi:raffinose/stachyose/melibiose transport system substrate-binding protein